MGAYASVAVLLLCGFSFLGTEVSWAYLAALGLTSLALVPWLIYKMEFVQALLIGANLFVVARYTKELAPLMALRVRAHQGDRAALRMLELHDPLWKKIRETVLQPASDPH